MYAVAQWLEHHTLDHVPPVKPSAFIFTLHGSSSLSCINEYLAIDIGGYLCMNSLCALISTWLDASQKRRDGV